VGKATATEHSKSEKFLLSSRGTSMLMRCRLNTLWTWQQCFCMRAYWRLGFFHTPAQKRGSSVLVCILHYYCNPCLHNGA
jgi:hypothetical protein